MTIKGHRARGGFTLTEAMLTFALLGVVILFVHKLGAPISSFFQHSLARQKANNEARSCLNTISVAMRAGLANSVCITTPAGVTVPNSRIDFITASKLASGTTAYAFYLTPNPSAPNWTVQKQEFNALGMSQQPLATNVTSLMFTGDYRDPSVLYVSLRIDAAFGSSGQAVTTVDLPDQEVRW